MKCRLISSNENKFLKFDCGNCNEDSSIFKNPVCLGGIIQQIEKHPAINSIILDGKYVQEIKQEDIDCLKEYVRILYSARYFLFKNLTLENCTECLEKRKAKVTKIYDILRTNPSEGENNLKQLSKEFEEKSERGSEKCKNCRGTFLKKGLEPALKIISNSGLLKKFTIQEKDKLSENSFSTIIRPNFLKSKLDLEIPENVELVEAYEIQDSKIRIYYSPSKLEYLYFLMPSEFKLPPFKIEILQEVQEKLVNQEGSLNPDMAKEEIRQKSRNLIVEAALRRQVDLSQNEIENLAKSLAKFTAGLGIIEKLLEDQKIQDIYIDAPVGNNPIYVHHQEFEECLTNIFLTPENVRVLTSRFRAISGRPFSEANPTLDLNLNNVRVAAIQKPLSPDGVAFAIRRHKSSPWTLPMFIEKDFLTPDAAGLLSLIVDSQASILITGSRGAGKTSLLGALLLEILPKYRILCLEDTAELPIGDLRSLGYKAQRLQVRPSNSGLEVEMSTEDALRAALRLGESVLVMGEVRGPETKSLYEAMRVGAAGNSVMGTIHGSSTEDVFERVVYDLGIPSSSFKATDVIVVASPIRLKGSIKRNRRLVQISEVDKNWRKNPINENGFSNLMIYDSDEDKLKLSDSFKENKSNLLRKISKKWSMSVQEVQKNFEIRSKIQKTIVRKSLEKDSSLLESENVVKSNLIFHKLLENELSSRNIDYSGIYSSWKEEWLSEVL